MEMERVPVRQSRRERTLINRSKNQKPDADDATEVHELDSLKLTPRRSATATTTATRQTVITTIMVSRKFAAVDHDQSATVTTITTTITETEVRTTM